MRTTYKILAFVALLLLLSACVPMPPVQATTSQQTEQQITEDNQAHLVKDQPIPRVTNSLERENLINRVNLLNDRSKVFYIYLISYGKVMAFYTAKGKVSSVSSYLTTSEQIVRDEKCAQENILYGNCPGGHCPSMTSCYFSVEAPDLDGSYGTNGDGIFFFTTEGAYVEWKGEYMVSDFPLKLSTPPELVKNVDGGH